MLALSACAKPPLPEICTSMRPVYFPDEAILALRPYRQQREQLSLNNQTWEKSCAPRH